MARGIVVYRGSDVEHLSASDWRLRDGAKPLYDEPLGGEGPVREFWSAPAAQLGLPLLAAVYEHGFYLGICWHGDQLDAAEAEVARLEEFWQGAGLDAGTLQGLSGRAAYLRTAVGLAREHGGILVIS